MQADSFCSADLAGVEVGETAISDVRGEAGELIYRGRRLDELVGQPFWGVVWLVLFGEQPSPDQEQQLGAFAAENARLSGDELKLLASLPRQLHPMLMLQGVVPLLDTDQVVGLESLSATARQGLYIAVKLPLLIAAWRQLEFGNEPSQPDPSRDLHENFLALYNGAAPTTEQVRVLDATQIIQMEHGFNAGTFAGRVCASTKAPIQSSISASIGTLFGVLHGGADQAALEMADTIGAAEQAEGYVDACLVRKEKIMGMGHREYRVLDPRAVLLKPMAESLCTDGKPKQLFDTLVAVEQACQKRFAERGKEIWANVEFYKGAVFYQLGVEPRYFTALFAMARVYGYIAHYLEFSEDSRLIRPRARYIGPS